MTQLPITYTIQEINNAARVLLALLYQHKVVALHAPMGAGKTTLVSHAMHIAGSPDAVSSPTFAIMNEYVLPDGKMVWHMDWYRIEDEDEAIDAGIEDSLYSGDLCLVEWPEKVPGLLPDSTVHVQIVINEDGSRTLAML